MSHSELLPVDFAGIVRLFPLPDLVMFPHVVQPLRIFEPRYVKMFEDALADDQLLAMALLQPGWEVSHESRPAICQTVCVGRIMSHSRLPEGTYNVLIAGAARARVLDELPFELAYRRARVELMADEDLATALPESALLRARLLRAFQALSPGLLTNDPAVHQLLHNQVRLSVLTDVISFAIPLKRSEKLKLLEEPTVSVRAEKLIDYLNHLGKTSRPAVPAEFPPSFSDN